MNYRVLIHRAGKGDDWETTAYFYTDSPPELAQWLEARARDFKREPYMAAPFDGEEPLEGL